MNLFAVFTKLNLTHVFVLSFLFLLVSMWLFFQFLKPLLEQNERQSSLRIIVVSYLLTIVFYLTILMIQWRLSPQLQIFDPSYSLLNYIFYAIFVMLIGLFLFLLWQIVSLPTKMTNQMLFANLFNLFLLFLLLTDIISFVFFHPYSIVLQLKNKKTLQQRTHHLDQFLCRKPKLKKQQSQALEQHWRNLEFANTSFRQYLQKNKKKTCPVT